MPNMSMFPFKPKVKKVIPCFKLYCAGFFDDRNDVLGIAAQPTFSPTYVLRFSSLRAMPILRGRAK